MAFSSIYVGYHIASLEIQALERGCICVIFGSIFIVYRGAIYGAKMVQLMARIGVLGVQAQRDLLGTLFYGVQLRQGEGLYFWSWLAS